MSGRHAAVGPFQVLFVCSGNICRSPVAEQLFRARAAQLPDDGCALAAGGVAFSSAGVIAREGDRMTDQAAELSSRYGADPSSHLARVLTADGIREVDLVITMTRDHRREVVTRVPRASAATFTLNEFARLLDNLVSDPSQAAALPDPREPSFASHIVMAVASRRGYAPPANPDDDDILDPYRRSQDTYDQAGAAIERATTSIFDAVTSLAQLRRESVRS